ncbi:ABC-F family ATP-binding cassette domain-containing protein [Pseudoglutamicibacter albus]|uniref:ABC-F family ATP-binding cassette domain-containing protein n=1 Tax=Pseudoglutamicibacter albus TaxID=98671 RepID=UPI000C77FDA2|nr:ABC-F family ATP-binding cassette domain-containing protein [Pseudoglutamicibacter albus]PKY80361.1 glycerophosphodiester phosphodiesterase [Pseudoglutamicibacter albus]WIK84792.1 ABC-F family ATP-binding cassette domain-containing protein [Pseudoglutamicibacter albus]
MSHLLGAESISITFGTRTVLEDVTLGIDEGDRIGIVGRNGDGKSTLMKLLAQRMQPDTGRVTHRRDLRVGYLDQSDVLDPELSVLQAIVGDVPEHEWAADPRIRDIMDGLTEGIDLRKKVGELSGGQRRRTALAKLLVADWDVIMLDEPTNHLDVEGVAWLAQHLNQRWRANENAFLVVTHDRWFLDAVCTMTWEVHDAVVDAFDGGYAAYVLARAERDRAAAVKESKRQQLVKKELAWLRRGAPARTSKPKFRIQAANAIIEDVPAPRESLELKKMAMARQGKDVIDAENLTYTLPNGRTLFDNITWRLAPGERVGLVGVNGAGKSTLMRLLDGQIEPSGGRVKRGKTVVSAILSQEVKELDELADTRVVDVIKAEGSQFVAGGREVSAGQLLEQVGFNSHKQYTPVRDLSGGEKRRLQLLRLMVGEPNVLMLDEPTNDLDTDTLAAIEDLLDTWAGTLIVVSHDRYLLERVTDHQMALLGDGKIRDLPGGVDQYLQLREQALQAGGPQSVADQAGGAGSAATASSAEADTGAEPSGPTYTAAEQREARKNMQRYERQLERAEKALAEAEAKLVAATEAGDFDAVTQLTQEASEARDHRDELEMAWLEESEKVD